MTRYRVSHATTYEYDEPVSSSYSRLHLLPSDLPGQRCLESAIAVSPAPEDRREHRDYFGNRVEYVAVQAPHRELTITGTSVVDVDRPGGTPLFGQRPWEEARDAASRAGSGATHVEAVQFALDSPRVRASAELADYARPSFAPGRPIAEAVVDLASRIHRDFEFVPGVTQVDTPVEEVFAGRRGVCQDFAHVGIACLRSLGIPARYVSGYLETDPPPGRPKLVGADVSHAWLSVLVPGAGWLDVDPTNDQVANDRYVVAAIGRDYGDVAPINGVVYTRATTQRLTVQVDVTAVDALATTA